ncbi:MAG: hypothetical protein WBW88_06735, partial [Rhodothermales bacterium]
GTPVPLPTLDNEGVYQYSGAGTSETNFVYQNNGELRVLNGIFDLDKGGSSSSQFTVADGATLNFASGSYDLGSANFTTDGTGLVRFSSPSTTDMLSGILDNGGGIEVSGSDITFTQTSIGGMFLVSGGTARFLDDTSLLNLQWSGGTIRVVDSKMLSVNGPATLSGSNKFIAARSTIELNAKTIWSGGAGFVYGDTSAVLVNNDTLLQSDFAFVKLPLADPLPTFDNEGVYEFDSGNPSTNSFIFDNAGETQVLGGNLEYNAGGTNTGRIATGSGTNFINSSSDFTNATTGIISGNGTFWVSGDGQNYTNDGTFAPGASVGILTFKGNYSNSNLEIEINDGSGPGVGNDLLSVTANAPLSDTLSVILDSGYTPAFGQQFKIVSCGVACSGGFSKILVNKANVTFSQIVNADTVSIQVTDLGAAIHVRAFLEGPYLGGSMSTTLEDNGDVPLSQPFSDAMYNGTYLDFDSTQTVASLPDSTVDWVLVSLRTGTGVGTEVPGSKFAALMFAGGTVASPGDDSLRFNVSDGSYYLVLETRNHLGVMSSAPVLITGGVGSWDFTTAVTQAYGTAAEKNLGSGNWGLYGADGNADGQDTALDFTLWLAETTSGASGYKPGDFNLDRQVTALDFTEWLANTTAGVATKVPN